MQLKTLFIIALATCTATGAMAQKKKKNSKKTVPAAKLIPASKFQSVPADTFSYAVGVAQANGLKNYIVGQMAVDTTYIAEFLEGVKADYTTPEAQRLRALAAGLEIAEQNAKTVIPSINKQATGKNDTTYVDKELYIKGLADGIQNKATLTEQNAREIVERQMNYYKDQLRMTNLAWLEQNKTQKDVVVLPSGLQYKVLTKGAGAVATEKSDVEVHYEGRLLNGEVFDSSYKRGKPATFKPTQVIKGWTEALQLMPEGSKWELYIPYNLAYGERGNQNIPPYATLIFVVEVVKVKESK